MKKLPTFRSFLLLMVFVLEGLSLTVVIGFLFAMLDQSIKQELVSRVNVQQSELRLHLTNRLKYTYSRVEEIRFNNSIKVGLLVGMDSKINENVTMLYQPTLGSVFYVRAADGRYFPRLRKEHLFLKDLQQISAESDATHQMAVTPYTYVYFEPLLKEEQVIGHAVGVYDLSGDPHCYKLVSQFRDLSLVYKEKDLLADVFSHRQLPVSDLRVTEELNQEQYKNASRHVLTLLVGLTEFPSLLLTVDNEQYRERRWTLVNKLILLCIPLLLLTFTVSFLILKRVTNSLDALAKNAQNIADAGGLSDLDTSRVRHSEFLSFTQAFNKVLSKVRQQTDELQTANENLHRQIEERRRIAEALQESEAQLRSLQDNIPIGLFRRSLDGRFVFANPKMVSTFGFDSEEEMAQIPSRQLYYDPDQFDSVMAKFQTEGGTQNLELRFKRKDGTPIWGAVHLVQTHDPKSGDAYIDGALIDISDRKRIEKDKQKLEAQLRQAHKMEALGTLAGGIAHDFNNILFAIIGFCELAIEDAIEDTGQQDNLQLAITGAQRAAELVRQILTFARQNGIEKHPLNLTIIVKESLKLLRATLPKSIDIRTELDARQNVLADPTQMHQIIVNLCTNAFHSMQSSGGVLTIGLSRIDIKSGEGGARADLAPGPYAWLRVSDTGHGMSPKTLERIFDPYYTTKAQGDGTGMGLSVVQGIISGLDGGISVESSPGRGSTFSIYLPALDEVDPVGSRSMATIVGGREHILFVDDEVLLTNMVSKMLSSMGYHVTTCNNPSEALEMFRKAPEQFDLILSDVTMPDMGGHDMAKEMISIRPDLPVLLCTGYSDTINDEIIENTGIRALMYKPLVRHELFTTIRNVLDTASAADKQS